MISKGTKIIIVGRGGSGKDYLRNKFQSRGFKYSIPYTSRPKREKEKNGIDYHFVEGNFLVNNVHKFYSIEEFNGWKYGLTIEDFEKNDLFIMSPGAIKGISKKDRKRCFIIYLNPDLSHIEERLKKRKDEDSVKRRMDADNVDFFQFNDYDIMIKNPDF